MVAHDARRLQEGWRRSLPPSHKAAPPRCRGSPRSQTAWLASWTGPQPSRATHCPHWVLDAGQRGSMTMCRRDGRHLVVHSRSAVQTDTHSGKTGQHGRQRRQEAAPNCSCFQFSRMAGNNFRDRMWMGSRTFVLHMPNCTNLLPCHVVNVVPFANVPLHSVRVQQLGPQHHDLTV